jgi:hypothetical protein
MDVTPPQPALLNPLHHGRNEMSEDQRNDVYMKLLEASENGELPCCAISC